MKSKIYEKNDLKKYLSKNEEFKETDFPDYIRNSISDIIIPKKSFVIKNNISNNNNNTEILTNNKFYNSTYSNDQLHNDRNNLNSNSSFHNQNSNENMYNKEIKKNYNDYSSHNLNRNDNQQNTYNSGFSKFLQKKSLYDKLTELKDSIGKRHINSPFLVLSDHEKEKSQLYDKLTNTASNGSFVHSPRMLKSLISLNCKKANNHNDEFFQLKKSEENLNVSYKNKNKFFVENNLRNTNNFKRSYNSNFNENKDENEFNKSNSSFNLKNSLNSIKEQNFMNKETSKVNVLYKIEQYKDYLRFKGL